MFSPIRLTLLQCSPHLVRKRSPMQVATSRRRLNSAWQPLNQMEACASASYTHRLKNMRYHPGPALGTLNLHLDLLSGRRCRHEAQVGRKIWNAAHIS